MEDETEQKTASVTSVRVEGVVMWVAPHIRRWAFVYVLGCYLAFVVANHTVLHIPISDPYGIAMVLIGGFWLSVMAATTWLEKRIST